MMIWRLIVHDVLLVYELHLCWEEMYEEQCVLVSCHIMQLVVNTCEYVQYMLVWEPLRMTPL